MHGASIPENRTSKRLVLSPIRHTEAYALPGTLDAPSPDLRFCIAIPARNEEASVEATLASLAAQVDDDGAPLAASSYEVVLFANGCDDATAARARAFAGRSRLVVRVAEGRLPADRAHVGTARRAVMDEAGARLASAGRPCGTIATTDADTIVHPRWIVETERALQRADAVGGRIYVAPDALRRAPEPLRLGLENEERYRFAVARAESARDPLAHDPWPRHGQQFAASLALRADVYAAVGGLPPLSALEDLALYGALVRADARFTHSLRVRVATSTRLDARATGGFGTHIARLQSVYAIGASQAVEDPSLTLDRVRGRAALRRWYEHGEASVDPVGREGAARTFALSLRAIAEILEAAAGFGSAFAAIEERASAAGAFERPQVRIERAIASLERAAPELARERLAESHQPRAGR